MVAANLLYDEETLIARLTEIAYQAVLRQGLQRSFVEVELELWRDVRSQYEAALAAADACRTARVA